MLSMVDISQLAIATFCLSLTATATVTARQAGPTGSSCCSDKPKAAEVQSSCCSPLDEVSLGTMKQSPRDDDDRKSEKPETDRVMLSIKGMTCEACEQAVSKALLTLEGVTEAEVNYDSGMAYVVFNVEDAPADAAFAEAVTRAGFEASVMAPSRRSSPEKVSSQGKADCCATPAPTADSCCSSDDDAAASSDAKDCCAGDADCFAPIDTSRQTINLSDKALAELSLVSLKSSLDPFIDRFNAAKDKTRIVALLSPTCGGCVEGARAVQKSIIEAYPDADLSVHIIWEPMLASDNETEARRSSIFFPDQGVYQYYDPERRSGFAYLKDLFPDYRNEIRASAPANHADRGYLKPGQSGPMWDIYFVYEPGVTWGDSAPKPAAWVKQVLYYPDRTGLMWADDFSAAPLESNLMDEVGALMDRLKGRTTSINSGNANSVNLQMLAFPSCPNSVDLRASLEKAISALGLNCSIRDVNLEDLEADDPRLRYGAPTILINGVDLMGDKPLKTGALCCRTYDDGELPNLDEIIAKLSDCCSSPIDKE